MKYIDADKLLSEINDRIERCEKDEEDGYPDTTSSEATLKSIRSFIASLQQEQPEADLDREIIKYKVPFTDESEYLNETTLDAIARHFYELGLNARKEK